MKTKSKKLYASSLIWSNYEKYAKSLNRVHEDLQIKILEEKIYNYVGNIIKINDNSVFDLAAHLNFSFFSDRIVYLGDSAHSVHPIAGQGWNLGVRDVKNIKKIIEIANNLGLDIGSNFVCEKYHDISFNDAYSLFQITDKLNSIFLYNKTFGKGLRKAGISFIEENRVLKKYITNYAMGV